MVRVRGGHAANSDRRPKSIPQRLRELEDLSGGFDAPEHHNESDAVVAGDKSPGGAERGRVREHPIQARCAVDVWRDTQKTKHAVSQVGVRAVQR